LGRRCTGSGVGGGRGCRSLGPGRGRRGGSVPIAGRSRRGRLGRDGSRRVGGLGGRRFGALELCAKKVGDLRLDDAELILCVETEALEEREEVFRRHPELLSELENPGFTGWHAILLESGAPWRRPSRVSKPR
jgi:hypothetical protein